jgi:hypothetical protein
VSTGLDAAIQVAFVTHLTTPALTSPATRIAYPFVAFTPTPGVKYLDMRDTLRGDPDHRALPFAAHTIHRGILQIDAVVPEGAGAAPGLELAALVAARFAIGTKLVVSAGSATYRLQILKPPTIAAAVMDAPWVRFPVSIPYEVIT